MGKLRGMKKVHGKDKALSEDREKSFFEKRQKLRDTRDGGDTLDQLEEIIARPLLNDTNLVRGKKSKKKQKKQLEDNDEDELREIAKDEKEIKKRALQYYQKLNNIKYKGAWSDDEEGEESDQEEEEEYSSEDEKMQRALSHVKKVEKNTKSSKRSRLNQDDESSDEEDQDEQFLKAKYDKREIYQEEKASVLKKTFTDKDEEEAVEDEQEIASLQKKRAARLSRTKANLFQDKSITKLLKKQRDHSLSEDEQSDEQSDEESDKEQIQMEEITENEQEIIEEDSEEFVELLKELRSKSNTILNQIYPILYAFKHRRKSTNIMGTLISYKKLITKEGLSYLEVKFHLLLSYCMNIIFYIIMKVNGHSVKDHPVIDQLIKIRLLLEKISFIDDSLKQQLDDLVHIANSNADLTAALDKKSTEQPKANKKTTANKKTPLSATTNSSSIKANPRNLETDFTVKETTKTEEEQSDEEESEEEKENIYEAPKMMEVNLDFEKYEKKKSKERKEVERLEKKLKYSTMVDVLKSEIGEEPEQSYSVGADIYKNNTKARQFMEELEKYEEDTFNRRLLSKKEKRMLKNANELRDDLKELDTFKDLVKLDNYVDKKEKLMDEKLKIKEINKRDQESEDEDKNQDEEAPLMKYTYEDESGSDDEEQQEDSSLKRKRESYEEEPEESEDYSDSEDEKTAEPERKKRKTLIEERIEEDNKLFNFDDRDENGKRAATDAIVQNRGLKPKRKKELSNPRKMKRIKFAKKTGQSISTAKNNKRKIRDVGALSKKIGSKIKSVRTRHKTK